VCGRVAIDDLELRARPVEAETTLARATLAKIPETLRIAQVLFHETGGVHCAALFHCMTGRLSRSREDVGRHNAVDKLVGSVLNDGLDPGSYALFLSGRAGYELVQKAVMLGVPVVAAVSAPSSLAIEIAERFRVALVGFVRGERFNIYSHGWRIA
jgi:FdhD protein